MPRDTRRLSPAVQDDLRQTGVALVNGGHTQVAVARMLGVRPATVCAWMRLARQAVSLTSRRRGRIAGDLRLQEEWAARREQQRERELRCIERLYRSSAAISWRGIRDALATDGSRLHRRSCMRKARPPGFTLLPSDAFWRFYLRRVRQDIRSLLIGEPVTSWAPAYARWVVFEYRAMLGTHDYVFFGAINALGETLSSRYVGEYQNDQYMGDRNGWNELTAFIKAILKRVRQGHPHFHKQRQFFLPHVFMARYGQLQAAVPRLLARRFRRVGVTRYTELAPPGPRC